MDVDCSRRRGQDCSRRRVAVRRPDDRRGPAAADARRGCRRDSPRAPVALDARDRRRDPLGLSGAGFLPASSRGPEPPSWGRGGGRLQRRSGRGFGRQFVMYKFRTMHADAAPYARSPAAPSDSRLTRLGAFLRATCLDELPQLFNVLRGDMGLVGPGRRCRSWSSSTACASVVASRSRRASRAFGRSEGRGTQRS